MDDFSKMLGALVINDALATGDSTGAIERGEALIRADFAGRVPDSIAVRRALECWGVRYQDGASIPGLTHSRPALRVALPQGWAIVRGRGGWVYVKDAHGADRIGWYVHAWDPIHPVVYGRYVVVVEEYGSDCIAVVCRDKATGADLRVWAVTLPHEREWHECGEEGYWTNYGDSMPEGGAMENANAREAAYQKARDWLRRLVPGWDSFGGAHTTWAHEVEAAP